MNAMRTPADAHTEWIDDGNRNGRHLMSGVSHRGTGRGLSLVEVALPQQECSGIKDEEG